VDTLRTNGTLLEVDVSMNNAPHLLLAALARLLAENAAKHRGSLADRLQDEVVRACKEAVGGEGKGRRGSCLDEVASELSRSPRGVRQGGLPER